MDTIMIGIDNGLKGAVAVIQGTEVVVFDMPVIIEDKGKKTHNRFDDRAMANIVSKYKDLDHFVVLEAAQAFPKQGGVSNFSTGLGFGIWRGILAALGMKYQIIHPKTWQKVYSIAGDTKGIALQVVKRMYPKVEVVGPKGGVKDGRVDALLMADFAKRIYQGGAS